MSCNSIAPFSNNCNIIFITDAVSQKINPRNEILSIPCVLLTVKLSIFMCQILDTWHSIILVIKKLNYLYCNILSNKFQVK